MLIDHDTMDVGLHQQSVCETGAGQPVPPDTVRRVGCDADVVPVVVDSTGVVLSMGRTQRTATAEQRTALRVMYRTCAHPDCLVGFDACDIHHATAVLARRRVHRPGQTWIPLCQLHHHHVHEGGWTLTLQPDRTIHLRRPDGTLYHEGTTVDVAPRRHRRHRRDSRTRRRPRDQILTRNRHGPPAA